MRKKERQLHEAYVRGLGAIRLSYLAMGRVNSVCVQET